MASVLVPRKETSFNMPAFEQRGLRLLTCARDVHPQGPLILLVPS